MNDDLRDRAEQLEDAVGEDDREIWVISIGGDPVSGMYSPAEYREAFGEDPPEDDDTVVDIEWTDPDDEHGGGP